MKSTPVFRDQVTALGQWFERWNECEQTVALYSLVHRLSPVQARFLARVLNHAVAPCNELHLREQQANNPVFVESLCREPREVAISQLLLHLPLLSPGNREAKNLYLELVPSVLAHAWNAGTHTEECRQLLSYSLIHPALTAEDRRSLTLWLHHLEDTEQQGNNSANLPPGGASNGWPQNGGAHQHNMAAPSNGTSSSPLLVTTAPTAANQYSSSAIHSHCNNGGALPAMHELHNRRSNSLTPSPTSTGTQSADDGNNSANCATPTVTNGTCNGPVTSKQRSLSLSSSDHAPLSPESSLASSGSGSEGHLDDTRPSSCSDAGGMRDVPSWLKSLRLHKYAALFAQVTYDEMMSLSEEQLEAQGVTKGARHKIVLSIQKLKERQNCLRLLEKEVMDGGNLRNALLEIRSVLMTPLKAFAPPPRPSSGCVEDHGVENTVTSSDSDSGQTVAEGDLPGQFTRLLGKVCTQLLVLPQPDDESCTIFVHLLDKCLSHEAFSLTQKKRLLSWRQQIQKAWHPLPPRRNSDNRHPRGRWVGHHNGSFSGESGLVGGCPMVSQSVAGRRRTVSNCPASSATPFGHMANSHSGMVHQQISQQRSLNVKRGEGLLGNGNDLGMSLGANMGQVTAMFNKRPSLQEPLKPHVTLQRTKSAPVNPNRMFPQFTKHAVEPMAMDPEISLESLCLSVTEHALGGLGNDGPSVPRGNFVD